MVEQGVWAGDEKQPYGCVHLSGTAGENSEQINERVTGEKAQVEARKPRPGAIGPAAVMTQWASTGDAHAQDQLCCVET